MTMLSQLAFLLRSSKFGYLISVSSNQIIIHNQYIFLWKVLPSIFRVQISKSSFIREMRKLGFEYIINTNELKNQVTYDRKKVMVFRGTPSCLTRLQQLQNIRQQKNQQILMLKKKTVLIESLLEAKQENQICLQKSFILLEAISSLQQINRKSYALNNQSKEAQDAIYFEKKMMELQPIRTERQQTFLDINTCRAKKKRVQFYSHTQLQIS